MTAPKRLALIPARGGSQRIPRKNIRRFCGQPIIKYSIDAAKASGLFDVIMVSTDDHEIAEVARQFGAEVPFMRSAKNADHEATTLDVIQEVLASYRARGVDFESCCCIYPTAPLIQPESLRASFEQLERDQLDSVFPVVAFDYPIQRATRINAAGCLELIDAGHRFSRSQDLEPAYHDAGQFYTFRTDALLKTGDIWTEKTGAVVLNPMQVQDIDTEDDWTVAELKFERIHDP